MRAALIACLLVVVCSACAGSDVSGNRRIVGDASLAFTVTPSRIELGKAVRLQLRVTNSGGRPEVLNFSSGQMYDFWVTDSGREVWRWSDDRAFTQALQKQTVASQDSVTFDESWTTSLTGTLTVHGRLLAQGFDRELTGRLQVDG